MLMFKFDFRFEKVAYLDTDVGQTEFTPPGCLSLTILDKITPGESFLEALLSQFVHHMR